MFCWFIRSSARILDVSVLFGKTGTTYNCGVDVYVSEGQSQIAQP